MVSCLGNFQSSKPFDVDIEKGCFRSTITDVRRRSADEEGWSTTYVTAERGAATYGQKLTRYNFTPGMDGDKFFFFVASAFKVITK